MWQGTDHAATPPEHRRAWRRPPGRRAAAAPIWRGRAPERRMDAAPLQGGPVTRETMRNRRRVGWAGATRCTRPRALGARGRHARLTPHRGGAPPPYNKARPAGRASAFLPGPGPGRGGGGGEPAARGVRRAQSPRAWRVRPRPSWGVGLTCPTRAQDNWHCSLTILG